MSNSKKNYSLTLTDIITLIVLGLFPVWKIFNINADFPVFVFVLPIVIYIAEEIVLNKKTLKQIISEGGKKFMGLLLILVIPGFIYLFISKADNNFMTLSFVGPKEHVIPDFSFVNQNNEQIDASGSPIELSFKENDEKINGQANRLQIIQNTLYLRDNVIIFRQGNEIKTQEVKIILKEND